MPLKFMRRPYSLALLLTAAAIAVAAGLLTQIRATAQTTYPTTEIPCPEGVPPGEVEGETITCGILTVPENYDEPDGRQIELTYAVLHSHSLSPAPDPIIDLRGGPGGTIVGKHMERRAELYDPLRRTRDVVLFDQRGTKYSNELLCGPTRFVLQGPLETVLGEEAVEAIGTDLLERFQPMFPEATVDTIYYYAMMATCAEVLEAHGVDLSQYNSPNNAQDTVNLATALGYDDINLYGISYGTYLAQQIMRDHPDRLRSVVLDSTVTVHVNKYEISPRTSDVVLFNLIDDCAADADCAATYPDLKERTIALVNSLADNPIPLDSPVPHPAPGNPTPIDRIDPVAFIGLITLLNKKAPQVAPYVPLLVHELEQGITTTFAGLASGDLLAPEAASPLPDPVAEFQLQAEDLRVQAEELLRAEAALAQTQRPASQWVQQIQGQIATLPEAEQFVETANFYGIGYQSGKPRNRETLLAYVDETFEGDVAQALTADVNALSAVEVRHVYEIVSAFWANVLPLEAVVATGMFRSVDCRETVAFSDRAATEAAVAELAMPALAADEYVAAIDSYNICQVWPVEPAPASEHALLESDIPTLLLQGRYDTQTNSEMGRRATEGLSNGRYVEFSSAGHMVFQFSDCAKDVGVAFVMNPEGELNTSCTADLFPEFVLPPADVSAE